MLSLHMGFSVLLRASERFDLINHNPPREQGMVPSVPAQANHKPSAAESFPIANAIASAIPRSRILKLHTLPENLDSIWN